MGTDGDVEADAAVDDFCSLEYSSIASFSTWLLSSFSIISPTVPTYVPKSNSSFGSSVLARA